MPHSHHAFDSFHLLLLRFQQELLISARKPLLEVSKRLKGCAKLKRGGRLRLQVQYRFPQWDLPLLHRVRVRHTRRRKLDAGGEASENR